MQEINNAAAPDPEDFTDSSPNPGNDSELAILCDFLQDCEVSQVDIRYEGCGDEGCIEVITYQPAHTRLPRGIEERLRELAEGYCPEGYENNEGGFGCLVIYPALGLAKLEHNDRYEDEEAMETATGRLPTNLYRRLHRRSIHTVTARFDGYGDSGQFHEVTTEPGNIEMGTALQNDLEDYLYTLLPGGWENNEGGHGTCTIDVQTRAVDIDAFWRVQKASDTQFVCWQWRK